MDRLAVALHSGVVICAIVIFLVQMAMQPSVPLALGVLGALAVVSVLALVARSGRVAPRVLLAVYVLAIGAWGVAVSSQQVSDFGVYLRCGTDDLSPWVSLKAWSARCESAWLPGFGIYWRRSLLYSLPIGWLAGGAYGGFKIANVACHVLAVLMLYRGTAMAFGRAAGIVAAALLALYPEFWFVTTVVSSDNLAVVLLIALIFCLPDLDEDRRGARIILVVVLLVALDFLRSIGPILVLALLFLAATADKRQRKALLLTALLSVVALGAVGYAPSLLGMETRQTNGLLAYLVGSGVAQSQPFDISYGWQQYVLPLFDGQQRHGIQLGFVAHELRADGWPISLWMKKIVILLEGDGYYFFSNAGPMGNPDDYLLSHVWGPFAFTAPGSLMLRGVMSVLCLLAAAGGLRSSSHPVMRSCIAITSAFLLLVIVVGESQPRYSVLIAPVLCIAAGSVFAMPRWENGAGMRDGLAGALVVVAATLLSVSLVRAAADAYAERAPRLEWSLQGKLGAECAGTSGATVEVHRVVLDLSKAPCQTLQAIPSRLGERLVVHVLRTPVPPKWKHGPFPVVQLAFVLHGIDGGTHTVAATLDSNAVVLPVTLPTQQLESLEVMVRADAGVDGGVSLGFLHDGIQAIGNAQ